MTKPCNRPGDRPISRQAVNGTHGVGGDCVICVKENPDDPDLDVLQIVEGMAHRQEDERVEIPLLMIVRNPWDIPLAMRVIHRGLVKASLKRFCFSDRKTSDDEGWENRDLRKKQMMDTLRGLYAGRLCANPDGSGTALFHRRVNSLGLRQKPDTLFLDGPDQCFIKKKKDEISIRSEFPQGSKPSFCSFLLPPVAPKRMELFVLWLTLEGKYYRELIGDTGIFTVDSHTRLIRQIRTTDIKNASPEGQEFYSQYVEPDKTWSYPRTILNPAAYDIVILQGDMSDPIIVEAGSICILQVRPEKKSLKKQALWFYGQPDEFYLVLRYEEKSAWKPPTSGFIITQKPTEAMLQKTPRSRFWARNDMTSSCACDSPRAARRSRLAMK